MHIPGFATAPIKREAAISARVFRAATGKWEDLGVVARSKVSEDKVQALKKELNGTSS